MNIARISAAAFAASASLILLAGCSLSGSQTPATSSPPSGQQVTASLGAASDLKLDFLTKKYQYSRSVLRANPGPGWLSRDASTWHLVYVADQGAQAVYIFPQVGRNQAPIGKITSGVLGPNGLFVDKARRLYVCNFGGGTVSVYNHGALTPVRILKGAGSAIDVVVGIDGTVYVSNWDSGSSGTLLEYPKGHNTPTVTININGASEGLALDTSNNLYVAYNDATVGDGEVLKFAPGSTVGTNLGIHVGYVGGATIDSSGNLLVDDQNIPGVDVFPPGATQPSQVIKGFSLAFDIALNQQNTRLWVTQPFAAANEVTYPGGKLINSITNTINSAFGVAASPSGSP